MINESIKYQIKILYLQYVKTKHQELIYKNKMKTTRSHELFNKYRRIYIANKKQRVEYENKIYRIKDLNKPNNTGINPILR